MAIKEKVPLILAHDYLVQMGTAERVVAAMVRHHADAPIYTSAFDRARARPEFTPQRVCTTWMQWLPSMRKLFKLYFPLYPAAFRSFGEVDCEVAWISASTFAKCLRVVPSAVSVCYCHNPTRFLWQTEGYLDGAIYSLPVRFIARLMFPWMRLGDRKAAQRMDIFIANSQTVRERIQRFYGREARVLHPPVDISRFQVSESCGDYHLIVSRLISSKRIDRAVEAFNQLGRPLVIVGEGPDLGRLKALAGPHIRFTGRVSDIELHRWFAGCRALVLPGEEDFAMPPVEAQACGKPVIAWRRGGALETVRAGETGILFEEGNHEALANAVTQADSISWDPGLMRRWATTFSEERFLREMDGILEEARAEHQVRRRRDLIIKSSVWDGAAAPDEKFSPHSLDSVTPAKVPMDRKV